MTNEEYRQQLTLEGIFTPIARKHRDDYFRKQNENGLGSNSVRFIHYTSAEAALKIISSKRLWMRNALCMSDYSEVQHGFQSLHSFFSEESKRNALAEALDPCAPGVLKEALDAFDMHWRNNIMAQTYISSLSEHFSTEDFHGRLSMWRAFGGGNTARVGIVLKIPWSVHEAQEALSLLFSPVTYLSKPEVHTMLFSVVENVKAHTDFLRTIDRKTILNNVFTMLLAVVTCSKHEGFSEEREWRAIYSPYRAPSPLMQSSIQVFNGIPQLVYHLPIDQGVSPVLADLDFGSIFDRLIIGPSPYGYPLYDAFRTALVNAGIPLDAARTSVFNSNIPIRA